VWFDADLIDYDPGTVTIIPGPSQVVIGNVTPAGLVTEFPPLPVPAGQDTFAGWQEMVSGPGGDLWFGDSVTGPGHQSQDFIGRVTTARAVTLFPISSAGSKSVGLDSLAAGPDGNLWFTDGVGKHTVLGRMSPSGVVTQFPIGTLKSANVANGSNGSLILTGQDAQGRNEVFRVSTAGALTRDKIPAAISDDFGTYLGPADGSLWFANEASGAIELGRITASGAATSYNLSGSVRRRFPFNATALGQDGNLYLLANGNITARVYRLSPSELPPTRGAAGPQSRG
jgi:streptogramin lyase